MQPDPAHPGTAGRSKDLSSCAPARGDGLWRRAGVVADPPLEEAGDGEGGGRQRGFAAGATQAPVGLGKGGSGSGEATRCFCVWRWCRGGPGTWPAASPEVEKKEGGRARGRRGWEGELGGEEGVRESSATLYGELGQGRRPELVRLMKLDFFV
ncbi:hypothetical protein BRADI_4g07485v3 [Brachypodium distachyon]|uniref:Uncharacterized protein n=1 Tax=Brachypodium distachyon TaxID=15368 RepID=A0A2K2CL13_BRADI|nr:hypothetical protein BRADI_4g07485v3 [Brachypodium distachyon]